MALNALKENRLSAKGCSSLVLVKKCRAFLLVSASKAFLFCVVLFFCMKKRDECLCFIKVIGQFCFSHTPLLSGKNN